MATDRPTAGYSGTPLPKKLGFKPGCRYLFEREPDHWEAMLGELPDGCRPAGKGEEVNLAILFALQSDGLAERFAELLERLASTGMLWVAWPKKASGYSTNLDGNVVRTIGLDGGLVDIKVCAIDDFWSGLKFVKRIENR